MCKPRYSNQCVCGVYFKLIIKKTLLLNGNIYITDPITKMKVVHTSGQCFGSIFRLDMKGVHLENSEISLI